MYEKPKDRSDPGKVSDKSQVLQKFLWRFKGAVCNVGSDFKSYGMTNYCSFNETRIQKIRCVSVRVSLSVSVCVCRGLRCSWEGLALLDCILPVLLLELDTFFHTHRPADGQTERWEWRKSVQPDYLKEATRFLLLHIFLELIFWRNTGMKMLYIKAVHAGLKGIA